jgi:myo-inositol 2-dehydrogenase/D-chiro-inositol 1-dehydrogenase
MSKKEAAVELRIGVIGAGAIGKEHITRISTKLSGARVTAVTDINEANAKEAAAICGARIEASDKDVIAASDVDALLVASFGPAHAGSVLAAIAAKKPVFCEKPLASAAADCKKIVDAEIAAGKKLVQVGFMRRYDRGYLQLKEVLNSGKIGSPLMIHCAHRNVDVASNYDTPMAVNDTAVHEIDALHWLTGEQYKSAQVLFPKAKKNNNKNLRDPQIMLLTTESGVIIDIEVFVCCAFGYDIQCQVVCENGAVNMGEPSFPDIKLDAKHFTSLETSWKNRFIDAYDVEIQDWINATKEGKMNGPGAWDGYVVAVTCDALIKAQGTGQIEPVVTGPCPSFYK